MNNSNFNRLLNKVPSLQYLIGMLPVLLIILYSIVNTFDVMNIYASITSNDTLVASSDIRGITEVNNNTYEYEALNSVEFKASTNSSLFKIYAMDEHTVSYEVESGELLYIKNSPITGNATILGDKLQYNKGLIAFGEQIAEVFLLEDGTYEIRYNEETVKTDEIIGLKVIGKDPEYYHFKLDDTGVITTSDIFFTSKLETDNFYVDINQQVILKNTSADFFKNYILGNRLYLVVISSIFFLVLVIIARKQHVLTELSKKVYTYIHIISCLFALATLLLTILLLS